MTKRPENPPNAEGIEWGPFIRPEHATEFPAPSGSPVTWSEFPQVAANQEGEPLTEVSVEQALAELRGLIPNNDLYQQAFGVLTRRKPFMTAPGEYENSVVESLKHLQLLLEQTDNAYNSSGKPGNNVYQVMRQQTIEAYVKGLQS